MKEPTVGDPPDDRAGSLSEVAEAIEGLSEADRVRLTKVARMLVTTRGLVSAGYDHEDLIGEAFQKTLTGDRAWRKGKVDVVFHLAETMRSLSSNLARKSKRSIEVNQSSLLREDEESRADCEDPRPLPDEALHMRETADRLRRAFAGDSVALQIMECWAAGYTGPDICLLCGISEKQRDAGIKKIRRRARAILEGGDTL